MNPELFGLLQWLELGYNFIQTTFAGGGGWRLEAPNGDVIVDNFQLKPNQSLDEFFETFSLHFDFNGYWDDEAGEYNELDPDWTNFEDIPGTKTWLDNQAELETEEGGMGTFETSNFEYGNVPNPTEYATPPQEVDFQNISFKQYLDSQYGSGNLSGALLSSGTAKEQMKLLGYEGTPQQIDLLGLGQLYSGMAEENLKKAMFTEVMSQKGGDALSEEDVKFFADLGAPEFESRLNLIQQQKTTRADDAFRNLQRTKDDISKAEEGVREQIGDLPSRLEESLIGGEVAFGRAGASELGYGGAIEAREGLSEKTQEVSEMESKELRKALEDLGIAGTRATEDYDSQIAQLDQSLKGGLLDITSGIGGEVSGAQNLVDTYLRGVLNPFSSASTLAELKGTDNEGMLEEGQQKSVSNYRAWT